MLEITKNNYEQRAAITILSDLIDALLFEDVFELHSKSDVVREESETTLVYERMGKVLTIPVYFSGLNVYRYARTHGDVKLQHQHQEITLNAVELWDAIVDMNPHSAQQMNVTRFREGLVSAQAQLSAQYERLTLSDHPFIQSEQFASLKDRPFHPLAKEKRGLSAYDYERYQSEYYQPVALKTVAIHRDALIKSQFSDEEKLLQSLGLDNEAQYAKVLQEQGLQAKDFMIFPVHPWQLEHVLPEYFEQEFKQRIVVPLDIECGSFLASSSMRSLIDLKQPYQHVKVPFSMQSLGALRLTPTRYLLNGEKAEQLLEKVIHQSEHLTNTLSLCDEKHWWSFIEPSKDIFEDKIGHLTAQLRQYPHEIQDEETTLISMAALAMPDRRVYDAIFGHSNYTSSDVEMMYQDIVSHFIRTMFALMQRGVLPEVHGQNILIAFKAGKVTRFVLRDHDTVRIYPTWMADNGLEVPDYTIRKDTPNTLINENLETFFTYFQTLGISVNIYAVIDTLVHLYDLDEQRLMAFLRTTLKRTAQETVWPQNSVEDVMNLLFEKETWPFKRILLPLLHQKNSGGGSMPSSIGKIANPMMFNE
ncbi:staphyloferrin B biosynthesis protein SbnC [Staphylococcus ratti]|uniref:Staphyloferrin B biosynthesis protein SbnC n=1 Tax=Staphylococcus ratti TaxID=2892440 RepID=A0ABY3PCZ3_9STAP|nr:staphyloferrin B biosynthesis protein SbnC [Staphylococcus ratti]UEX90147.1 staphyloferrin B biosynthesis protein SbnC [Staphylococcus ratti]